jgi:hypothetical protein
VSGLNEATAAGCRARVASYTDEQLAILIDFLRRNRALLVRHTARFHEMLDKRQ